MISKGGAKEEEFVDWSREDESTINHGGPKEKREKETRSAATKERKWQGRIAQLGPPQALLEYSLI
jgi:hypothetical protein